MANKFAIVTGASTGIGFELASIAAENGYDLLVVADEPLIDAAAADFKLHRIEVRSVEADPATFEGVGSEDAITSGFMNKLQVAAAGVLPAAVLAEQHRKLAEPGSGEL